LRSSDANAEFWQCQLYFFVNDQPLSFGFFRLAQDQAMLKHARQIRRMLANSASTGNADPGTQDRLRKVLSQSIQAHILPLRSVFGPYTALVFSTKCKPV
jgi:hypothetical protein